MTSPHNSWTDLFKPRYIKRIILATAISTLQGMQYYGVGLYIPIIATYLISKDKIGVLLGTAIVNIAGILGAYLGAQLTYKLGTRKLTMIGFTLVLLSMVCVGLFYHHLPMLLLDYFYLAIQEVLVLKEKQLVPYHFRLIYVHKLLAL